MMRAVWNGAVLAQTDHTVVVEGNRYFPPETLDRAYFTESRARSLCPWKGIARYYTVTVDGDVNPNAAWYYLLARGHGGTRTRGRPVAAGGERTAAASGRGCQVSGAGGAAPRRRSASRRPGAAARAGACRACCRGVRRRR